MKTHMFKKIRKQIARAMTLRPGYLGLRHLGFRVWGLGFRVEAFRV